MQLEFELCARDTEGLVLLPKATTGVLEQKTEALAKPGVARPAPKQKFFRSNLKRELSNTTDHKELLNN